MIPMTREFVLTMDVGTSGLKLMLFDQQGKSLHRAMKRVSYTPITAPDGTCILDPDNLFNILIKSLDEFLAQVGPLARQIEAVGLCTFWHSIIGVGRNKRPVTPLLLWADSRSSGEAAELRARMEQKAYTVRTGCYLHSSYVPAKILWFCRHYPEEGLRVQTWMGFGEYVTLKLLGQVRCTYSMASGTGLLNQWNLQWDEEALNAIGLRHSQLPPLSDLVPFEPRWVSPHMPPPLRDALWFPAVGDGACSNVGCGALRKGSAALMLGTSAALRTLPPDPRTKAGSGLWRYLIDSNRPLIGGAQSNGGVVGEWLKKVLRLPEDWEEALLKAPPFFHRLTVLPFLLGERGPEWRDPLPGAVIGLSLSHSPLEITQAWMEAVCLRMKLIGDLIVDRIGKPEEVIGTGRALTQSRVWGQMMADALGLPITLSREPEASSRGVALLLLERLGVIRNISELPARLGRVIEPRLKYREAYDEALRRLRFLYRLVENHQTGKKEETVAGSFEKSGR